MVRVLVRILIVFGVALVVSVAALWAVYSSTQSEPTFYREALQVSREVYVKAGDEFENRALEVHNQLVDSGAWDVTFTAEQVNGWLVSDLPEKFPEALPKSVANPRIAFATNSISIAFHYDEPRFSGVVTATVEPFLTDKPNQLGIKVIRVRSGLIPLPIDQIMKVASREAASAHVPLQWTQEDGLPVALIQLDLKEANESGELRYLLEQIEIKKNQLRIRGRKSDESYRVANQSKLENEAETKEKVQPSLK